MKRVRGRRLGLLLASAFPLLAEDDIVMADEDSNVHSDRILPEEAHDNTDILEASSEIKTPPGAENRGEKEPENDTTNDDAAATNQNSDLKTRYRRREIPEIPPAYASLDPATFHPPLYANVVIPLRPFEYFLRPDEVWESYEICPYNYTGDGESEDESPFVSVDEETTDTSTGSQNVSSDADDDESAETTIKDDDEEEEVPAEPEQPRVVVDYASKSAGALVLEKSANFQGTSNLLTSNQDQYAIVECQEKDKFVVIGLSEDILVKQVVLANFERYSSHIKDFRIQGSTTMGEWVDLGTYKAQKPGASKNGKQMFDLEEPSWARYLKFTFLTHYGNEHYCTISQISVHGSTMLQGFHEQWSESSEPEESIDESIAEDSTDEISIASKELSLAKQEAIHPSSLLPCVTSTTGNMCQIASDFLDRQSHFQNFIQFETQDSNALVSISVWLSARNHSTYEYFDHPTQRFPGWHRHSFGTAGAPPGSARLGSHMSTSQSRPNYSMLLSMTDSTALDHVQGLIRSATGVKVSLEEIEQLFFPTDTEVSASVVETDANADGIESEPNAFEEDSPDPVELVIDEDEEFEVDDSELEMKTTTGEKTITSEPPQGAKRETPLKESVQETNEALATLLERLPSAVCLEHLDFSTFKAKHTSGRSGGTGPQTGSLSGHAMEPIFKKLTDEIRTLQASVSVHDAYATESVMCYQRVILELMTEMEEARKKQETRLLALERSSDWVGRIVGWTREAGGLLKAACVWVSSMLVIGGAFMSLLFATVLEEGSAQKLFFSGCASVLLVLFILLRYRAKKDISRKDSPSPRSPSCPPLTGEESPPRKDWSSLDTVKTS